MRLNQASDPIKNEVLVCVPSFLALSEISDVKRNLSGSITLVDRA